MTIAVVRRCPMCGAVSHISCDEKAWDKYENGALIQDAFPFVDIHTRETIISGMCIPCQEKFFAEEEDEEDEDEPCNGECDKCKEINCPWQDPRCF